MADPPAGSGRERSRHIGLSGNYWYPIELDRNLKAGQVIEVVFWKSSIAVFRCQDGSVHALENRCAHRQIRLSKGEVNGQLLTCVYHGWQYDGSGACVKIHHELGEGRTRLPRIRIRSYPVRAKYGFLWLFPGDPSLANSVPLPSIPALDLPRPWPCVPIDITIRAHHSRIVENVCDFNHEYLHRKYKPFTRPHLQGFHREGDTIHVLYQAEHGEGQLARLAADRTGGLGSIHLWYKYPYQGSDISGKYLHWLFMLPIDEETTRCFFVFLFGPIEIPLLRVNIPFAFRRPLLRLINALYVVPLLREDRWALEEEQRAQRLHAGRGSVELNPIVREFQQLSLEKWRQYLETTEGAGVS